MNTYRLSPPEHLAGYVAGILVIENCPVKAPFTLPLYANGMPTLLFQSAKGQIRGNGNYLTLFGQTVLPDTITMYEDFSLIAYFFKPFVLHSLFGISARELTDNPIDLKLLTPGQTRELQERLLHTSSVGEMRCILEQYIFSLITRSKAAVEILTHATSRIAARPEKDALKIARDELCMTERTFQRMFEQYIGLSPTRYRRICQFNSAFQELNQRKFQSLSELAFRHGYADQSHFIRAFREFTLITPKEYLQFAGEGR